MKCDILGWKSCFYRLFPAIIFFIVLQKYVLPTMGKDHLKNKYTSSIVL